MFIEDVYVLEKVVVVDTCSHLHFVAKPLGPEMERRPEGIDAPGSEQHLDREGHPCTAGTGPGLSEQFHGPTSDIAHGIPDVRLRKPRDEIDRVEQVGLARRVRADDGGEGMQVETEVLERLEAVDLDPRNHFAEPVP